MKTNSTFALLAMAALSAPVVVQAQDPATAYKQVTQLIAAGQGAQAIQLCDQVIKVYGNPNSRVAAQFIHMVPFFYYQKGDVLFKAKKYAEAYEVFKKLTTEPTFQKKDIIARAKAIPGNPQGYDPMISMAKFYSGYCLFQLAVGNPPKEDGDTSKFEQAIPELEAYLKLYESGKVSASEKKAKLDGSICFLLMQAYILKPEPDFKKADEYLAKSQSARAPLSDEMAMGGLMSVVKVALQKPEYIDWCYRIVSSNPESFNLGPVRMAPYIANMLKFGSSSTAIGKKFLNAGDMKGACGAFRSANVFFGLVPDTPVVTQTLTFYTKHIRLDSKSKTKFLPDTGLGTKHNPGNYQKLLKNYQKFIDTKMYPEAYATLQEANIGYLIGSKRIAKAGYHIMVDRYPDLQQEKDGKPVSMKDNNLNQYASLCRATGDEATAEEYEKKVDPTKVGKDSRLGVIANKMARCVKEEKWEEAISAADELITALGDDKTSTNYAGAVMTKLSAHYKLATGANRSADGFRKVIEEGEAILKENAFENSQLQPDQKLLYTTQASFFVLHSYHELAILDPAERKASLDTCVKLCDQYLETFKDNIDKDSLAPNVYYFGVDALLKRMTGADAAAKAADRKHAIEFCDALTKKWPEGKLAPICFLIKGQLLTSSDVQYKTEAEENEVKDSGLVAFEQAYKAALALSGEKDFNTASDALFLLYSYSPDFTREGEDEKAREARIQGYADTFWKEVYPSEGGKFTRPGNSHALKMAGVCLGRVAAGKDAKAFQTALDRARDIIAAEAQYGMEHNVNDPELEKTINGYASNYVDGSKKILGKELSMQERVDYFKKFPGIDPNNKYATAILRMCALSVITQEQASLRRQKDNAQAEAQVKNLQDMVDKEMEAFTRDYQPGDLTNYICLQVGNRLVADATERASAGSLKENVVDTALSYFDKVIERGGEGVLKAKLGRAKILSLSANEGRKGEAANLFVELSTCADREVSSDALVGVTRLHYSTKNYKGVIDAAKDYVARNSAKANRPESVEMSMMYAQALDETGKTNEALQIYMSIYNNNTGAVGVSAPATEAMMRLYLKRGQAAKGDRGAGTFKPSDAWLAWNTGNRFVELIKKNNLESKFANDPKVKAAFGKVEDLTKECNTPAVRSEEAANKSYAKASKR